MDNLDSAVALQDLPYARRYLLRGPWAPRLNSSSLRVPRNFTHYNVPSAKARRPIIHDDFVLIESTKQSKQPTLIHADVGDLKRRIWEMLYFEVKITFLPGGEDNIISLGACLVDLPPEQLYPNTAVLYNGVAYESTGRIMYSSASCRGIWDPPPLDPFFCRAAAFQEGDIIGCGFTEKGMQLFFTKNGRCIWESIPCIQYVPPWVIPKPIIVLGLGNALQNDACGVQVNFGRTPFMFNIEAYTEPIKQAIAKWRQAAASLPPELIHHIIIHTLPPLDSLFDHNALVLRTELVLCQSALSSVSNVCRRWWLTLRRVRFALVSISTVKRLQYFTRMASCTLSTANRNPLFISPGPYVKVLELFGEAAQRIYMLLFSSAAKRMTSIDKLIWNGTGTPLATSMPHNRLPAGLSQLLPSLFIHFAPLKTLVLESHRFLSLRTISRLIISLPNLTHLQLIDVTWPDRRSNYPPSWICRHRSLSQVSLEHQHLDEDTIHTVFDSTYFLTGVFAADRRPASLLELLSWEDVQVLNRVYTCYLPPPHRARWTLTSLKNDGCRVAFLSDSGSESYSISICPSAESNAQWCPLHCDIRVYPCGIAGDVTGRDWLQAFDAVAELANTFDVQFRVIVRNLSEAYDAWYDIKKHMPKIWGQGLVEVSSECGKCYPEPEDADVEAGVVFID